MNNKANLQVLLKLQHWPGNQKVIYNVTPKMAGETGSAWSFGSVTINETLDFYIILKGERQQLSASSIGLDNITFNNWPCPVTPAPGRSVSSNVGVIVGYGVGVVATVIAVAVLVVILHRRQMLSCWQTRSDQATEDFSLSVCTSTNERNNSVATSNTNQMNTYSIPSQQQRESHFYSTINITDDSQSKGDNSDPQYPLQADDRKLQARHDKSHHKTQRDKPRDCQTAEKLEEGDYADVDTESLKPKTETENVYQSPNSVNATQRGKPSVCQKAEKLEEGDYADVDTESLKPKTETENVYQSPNSVNATQRGKPSVCQKAEKLEEGDYADIEADSLTPNTERTSGDTSLQNDYSLAKPLGDFDNECGTYHVLEADADRDEIESYKCLDFEGRAFASRGSNPRESDDQYSHLKKGDEDTYNELNINTQITVIDGDYSHLGGS
ncbi:uncharacterized protein [Littorina saxatilis]